MNNANRTAPCRSILPIMAVGVFSGCASTQSIHFAANPSLDPDTYTSFHIIEADLGRGEADQVIETAIHQVMLARGYAAQPDKSADLYVIYKVLTVDRGSAPGQTQIANPGAGDIGNLPSADPGQSGQVDKLVLIQLQDAKSLQVVWVGWSRNQVDEANLAAQASKAANGILQRIPGRS